MQRQYKKKLYEEKYGKITKQERKYGKNTYVYKIKDIEMQY